MCTYILKPRTLSHPALTIAPIKAKTFMDIVTSQKLTARSKVSEAFLTSGSTSVSFLYPDCAVDI